MFSCPISSGLDLISILYLHPITMSPVYLYLVSVFFWCIWSRNLTGAVRRTVYTAVQFTTCKILGLPDPGTATGYCRIRIVWSYYGWYELFSERNNFHDSWFNAAICWLYQILTRQIDCDQILLDLSSVVYMPYKYGRIFWVSSLRRYGNGIRITATVPAFDTDSPNYLTNPVYKNATHNSVSFLLSIIMKLTTAIFALLIVALAQSAAACYNSNKCTDATVEQDCGPGCYCLNNVSTLKILLTWVAYD
jgi:hypothetical protein